jgi:hypothetical protein
LLDAGLSPADVAQMRRQFYESRGEEVPEGLEAGDVSEYAACLMAFPSPSRHVNRDPLSSADDPSWIPGDPLGISLTQRCNGVDGWEGC